MNFSYWKSRRNTAMERARGRWRDIFVSCGIPAQLVDGSSRPCPVCGGRDRFRFDDKFGVGNYFCRGCGPGDGFDLIAKFLQCSFFESLQLVERFCGIEQPARTECVQTQSAERSVEQAEREEMLEIWSQAHPVREGDPVWKYLISRGLEPAAAYPEIRTHDGLEYTAKDEPSRVLPVMLSRLTDADGVIINLHRTYLEPQGIKANVKTPKKLMRGSSAGGVVRLGGFPDNGIIGIAEGEETALGAALMFSMPVWATLGSTNMASLAKIPAGIEQINVFGDNDENYAGQAAAYAFAHKFACWGLRVKVMLPERAGHDWLDEWNQHRKCCN